jgi:hypothetical protein
MRTGPGWPIAALPTPLSVSRLRPTRCALEVDAHGAHISPPAPTHAPPSLGDLVVGRTRVPVELAVAPARILELLVLFVCTCAARRGKDRHTDISVVAYTGINVLGGSYEAVRAALRAAPSTHDASRADDDRLERGSG